MSRAKPVWPKVPAGFVRAMLAGHSALGLAFAALIYLVCFSGSVAVFTREFERWEQPQGPVLRSASPEAVSRAVAAAHARLPTSHDLLVRLPEPASPRLMVHGDDPQGRERTFLADGEGALVGEQATPFADFQARLHYDLHLPRTWGRFVVGLTGVALLSSLISGVLSHPRIFRDAFALRWGGARRLQEADLHNRLSVWALPFHVIVSLTGAFLGLTTIIVGVLALAVFKGDTTKAYGLFTGPAVADDPRPAPLVPLERVFANLERAAPGATPTYFFVEHPGEAGQRVTVNAMSPGRLSRGESYVFDGRGDRLGAVGYESGSVGLRLLSSLGPLHFGWFGGWPVKVAYAILGGALTVVTASGVSIWLARRRDKGRPAPRWERVWSAFAWSQPAAYGASALASLVSPAPLIVVWGLATLAALATAALWTRAQISTRLRLAGGGLLLATVAAHLATRGALAADPVAWIVDAAVLGLGVLLIAAPLLPSALARAGRSSLSARA